ncbi:MAG TPA: hypothetical protein VFQ05_00635 [Candidatus Eisenbacteria bacterium]|nr:hypothetical protein [Candidatus Eisenbacteria bacterium]
MTTRIPARRLLRCDQCGLSAWIGIAGDHRDAWCERCQRATRIPANAEDAPCPHCGEPLTLGEPRFEEIYGQLQNLAAVLEAWNGDAARLRPLVPERPRFLSDLDPPEISPEDEAAVRAALETLRTGAFADARTRLERLVEDSFGETPQKQDVATGARLWLALAIARQRLGDLSAAEAALTRLLDLDPGHQIARLDRGALRARRGDFEGARADLAGAGTRIEARWNRAALAVLEAVALGTGVPEPSRLEAARAEAGAPSSYWSDHTVGRLLFTVMVERAAARGADACGDARALRAAERELEFDTFDDRALLLLGYARLSLAEEVGRVAAPLAGNLIRTLADEPFAHGDAGRFLAEALEVAGREVAANRPAMALARIAPLVERSDLRHYRVPCAHCGQGTIGVEAVEDAPLDAAAAGT